MCVRFFRVPFVRSNKQIVRKLQAAPPITHVYLSMSLTSLYLCTTFTGPITGKTRSYCPSCGGNGGMKRRHCLFLPDMWRRVPCYIFFIFYLPSVTDRQTVRGGPGDLFLPKQAETDSSV